MPSVVQLMKDRGVKTVLDLGNGTGRHAVFLSKNGLTVYSAWRIPPAGYSVGAGMAPGGRINRRPANTAISPNRFLIRMLFSMP